MIQDIDTQQLLDAVDGVTYLVDASGIIRAIGAISWKYFATQNDAPELTANSVIGTSVFAGIDGVDVREACERLHDSVCQRQRPVITYEYRCDAPDVERRMRMSISPVTGQANAVMALYQSQLLAEAPRLPLGLMSMKHRAAATGAQSLDEQVALCSFCHDVAWPIGARQENQIWIAIEDYYRRGGLSEVVVSHGICPRCVERIITPNEG
jgi:hypothetical protein